MLRVVLLATFACGPRVPAAASAGQSVHDAMVLVCAAPARARSDPEYRGHESDVIAKHLDDGVGNSDVLVTVDGWKTDGIKRAELDRLLYKAHLNKCALRDR